MQRFVGLIVIGAAVAFLPAAVLAGGADTAKAQGCLHCHDVEKKKIGPAFRDVAARLKGRKTEEGVAAMKAKPVHQSVAEKAGDAALREIMDWVLTL